MNFEPQKVDLMVSARWIIPVQPEHCLLENHTLVVKGEQIIAILPSEAAKQHYSARQTHDLDQHILIPGLVNAHGHSAMTLFRGLADDLPLMEWLQAHIWPAEQAWVSHPFVTSGTRLAAAGMLLSGTTCINDMYFYPDAAAQVFSAAGMRANLGMLVMDIPTAWAASTDEYFAKGLAFADEYKAHPLIRACFAPHAPYTVTDAAFERVAMLAEELNLHIHLHLHETRAEIEQSLTQYNLRPIARLAALGILGPMTQAVHLTQVNDADIEQLSAHGVHVVHCPESNLKLASGLSPIVKLKQAGLNIALGTDGAASNNDLDMFSETRTAALLAKGVSGDATAFSAMEALSAATLGGALALGRGDEIGSLVVGKKADFVALEICGPAARPLHNPCSHVVYSANRADVSDVWIGGRHLVNNRQLTTLDFEHISADVEQWQHKINRTHG